MSSTRVQPAAAVVAVGSAAAAGEDVGSVTGDTFGARTMREWAVKRGHWLVGLGASHRHLVAEITLVANDKGMESVVVRHHASQIFDGTEQEIRLALGLGKRVKEGKDVGLLGDTECELLVQRGDIPCFSIGESSMAVGCIHASTTYFSAAACVRGVDSLRIDCHPPITSPGYAALLAGELVVREARADDARAIAEVSVASRRWSYRDLVVEGGLEALSVEEATGDFAVGLAELPSGAAVFVAELTGRVVGYTYVLPSPDGDVPVETSEVGSLYVTEEVAGTDVAPALMDAAIEHARAAGHDVLTLWVRRENGRARRFYEKHGMRVDGAERNRPHDVLPTQMNEIRYRMSLESD